jgi:geranylgeranyl diphosphate synthase type I
LQLLTSRQLQTLHRHIDLTTARLMSAEGLSSLSQLLRTYVRRGGKRVRPQLAVWVHEYAGGGRLDETPPAVLDVATAWELFHAFLLIHDDIIDGSDHRREHLSLHRELQSLDSDSPRFGVNLGIVAGDLMYAATQRVLADLDVSDSAYRALHKLFAHVATLTGFGQATDVMQSHTPLPACDESTLLREYHWKTAAYTFEGPMLSGAILAGMDGAGQDALSRFALSLGQAYQLQNDLIDLARPAADGCDLREGKRTVTLLHARAALGDTARGEFDLAMAAIQAGGHGAVQRAESFRQDLLASGATHRTRDTIEDLLSASETACGDPSLPTTLKTALGGLLQTLRTQYFAAV